MGQALAVNGSVPELTPSRSAAFASEYFNRFNDNGEGKSTPARLNRHQSLHLQERFEATGCCALHVQPSRGEGTLINANTGKPVYMDWTSLTDVNGEGVECREVLRAICVVPPPLTESKDGVTTREDKNTLEVDHVRDDAEVNLRPAPARLEVPTDFYSIGYDWSAASPVGRRPSAGQQSRLERAMKPFVRSMLTGVLIELRLEAGEVPQGRSMVQTISSVVSVSEDFSIISISAGSSERSVPIRAIRWVRPPEGGRDQEKCVDLRLAGGRFVRFQFDSTAQANYFGTCMRLLVKAARTDPAALSAGPQAV
mmetsp:Transcript_159564/g.281696  ORF Transcript_159564/g.281696 Transcript_159564/m.281696 type:complete len:311 (-) Transcript_159564:51-983(-)